MKAVNKFIVDIERERKSKRYPPEVKFELMWIQRLAEAIKQDTSQRGAVAKLEDE